MGGYQWGCHSQEEVWTWEGSCCGWRCWRFRWSVDCVEESCTVRTRMLDKFLD